MPQTGLLALVDELLLSIIDQIDSHDALCKLAVTCRRFQALAEPYIWRSLLVTSGSRAREIALALDLGEARSSYVETLSIRYPDHARDGIQELNHFIVMMAKLRHLTIESPCPNNSEWLEGSAEFDSWTKIDYTALLETSVFPRKGLSPTLPVLQSLTLHGHGPGDRKFTFGRCAVMFLHPTLKHITLSCTNFDAAITHESITDKQRRSTPLTSLTLIECNVNVRFLDVALSLPKALKYLDIGERLHTFSDCYPSMDSAVRTYQPAFLTALLRQADSLEHLSHNAGSTEHLPTDASTNTELTPGPSFSSFKCLRTLTLGIESYLIQHVQSGDYPTSLTSLKISDASCAMNIRPFPYPILHPARILRRVASIVQNMSVPVDVSILFASGHAEQFLCMLPPANIVTALENLVEGTIRAPLYTLAGLLRNSSRRLTLLTVTFPSGKLYIPPYMLGEEVPTEQPFYSSDDFWRVKGVDYRVKDDELFAQEVAKKPRMMCGRCRSDEEQRGCFNSGDGSACLQCEKERKVDGKQVECDYDLDPCTWG